MFREFPIKERRELQSITFGRYVRDAGITVPCTVKLGSAGAEFEIGPAVHIRCAMLELYAEALVVGRRTRPSADGEACDDTVILEALSYEGTLSRPPATHAPLQVDWPGAEGYPWTDFRARGASILATDSRLHRAEPESLGTMGERSRKRNSITGP